MKKSLLLLALMTASLTTYAQEALNGYYVNQKYNIRVKLALTDKTAIPGMEMDSCYGHITGNLNGMWVLLKVKKADDTKAVVRAISDRGGDEAQEVELKLNKDGKSLTMNLLGAQSMKTIEGRKYVKMPKNLELERQ